MDDDVEVFDVGTKAPSTGVSFGGRRGELAALLFRNLLLTLTTLGIYRFWAKTRVRAFLWRNVKLLDEPLEYLGNGTELLIGFLVVVVVLTPLTSLYPLLPVLIPEGIPFPGLIAQALYYALIAFLVQVAVYRARRYRLTRTAWRGVRFGLDGSALVYALIWSVYGLATLATLGLAYPWLRVATTRYFTNHARFGATGFSFDAGAGRLFRLWLVVIAPTFLGVLLFVTMNEEGFEVVGVAWSDYLGNSDLANLGKLLRSLAVLDYRPGCLLALSLVLLTWYRVNQFRHFLSAVRVGEVRLESRLTTGIVYALQVGFYFIILGVFAFLWVAGTVIVMVVANLLGATEMVMVSSVVIAVCVAGLLYVLYGLARKLFVEFALLKLACATLLLEGTEALEWTVQSRTALPGHGEGLADALDVGGF